MNINTKRAREEGQIRVRRCWREDKLGLNCGFVPSDTVFALTQVTWLHFLPLIVVFMSLGLLITLDKPNKPTQWRFRKKPQVFNRTLMCSKYLIVCHKFFFLIHYDLFGVLAWHRAKLCRWISSLNPNSLRGKQLQWRHYVGSLQLSKYKCSVWKRKGRKSESFTGTI